MSPSRILLPLSWLYGVAVAIRNLFFEIGISRIVRISVPVISVGNISAGGTGKTPFVSELVSILKKHGMKPAVVSRGYGRKSKGFQVVSNGQQKCAEAILAGDEPALLAAQLQGVPVVVDERKARGAHKAVELFAPDVVVLDDGFQHRSLFRDCDIVLLTADELTGRPQLLPAGYRREPFRSLRRANVIVISKCRDVNQFEETAQELRRRFHVPIIGLRTAVAGIRRFGSGKDVGRNAVRGKKTIAFSGIADSSSFDRTLKELGANVLAHHRFEDHHWYTVGDLKEIGESFQLLGAEVLVTTEKDGVRLEEGSNSLGQFPFFGIGVRSEIISGEKELKIILEKIVSVRK